MASTTNHDRPDTDATPRPGSGDPGYDEAAEQERERSLPTYTVSDIIAYENGESTALEALELFAALIRTGDAWRLQGSYGRAAQDYIEHDLITPEGAITDLAWDLLANLGES